MIARAHLLICFLGGLSVYLLTLNGQCHALDMGKADILLKYARICPNQDMNAWNSTIRVAKLSRSKTKFSFTTNAKTPIDKLLKLRLSISIWTNGGWKPNFYNIEIADICNLLKDKQPKLFRTIARQSNVTETCPIRAGPVVLKEHTVDMDEFNIPRAMLPYGKFMLVTMILRKKKPVTCLESVNEIVRAH